MTKEILNEIIRAETLSGDQLRHLDEMIAKYPWFSLPRFLKLRALHFGDDFPGEKELAKTVIFSSDRRALYNFVHAENEASNSIAPDSELEFIENDQNSESSEAESFELIDEGDEEVPVETHVKTLPEKEEAEMDDPELEESDVVPVMEPLDDLEEEEDEESEQEEKGSDFSEDSSSEQNEIHAASQDQKDNTASADSGIRDNNLLKNADSSNDKTVSGPTENLIEKFLKTDPGIIRADQPITLEGDVSERSVEDDDGFITDTLAKIYVKQGLHAKAIYAYERLSLKYPEKSAYFAAQIEKIKNFSNT